MASEHPWGPVSELLFSGKDVLFLDAATVKIGETRPLMPLPLQPMLDIRARKNIVITEVEGLDGTVKEDMGISDFVLTVRGTVQSTDPNPIQRLLLKQDSRDWVTQVQQIIYLFKKRGSLLIEDSSGLLQALGVERVLLKDFDLEGRPGYPNKRGYVLELLSDTDEELLLEEEV